MKNGMAISGKLSAPLMMFCATIWESNIPIVLISATPHDQGEGDRHAQRHGAEQREGKDRDGHILRPR
jgi:hypothetical protein